MLDITELKQIRKKLNLTQSEFADLAKVSQSLIAKIESNKVDPAYSKIKKIETALETITEKQEPKAKDIMIKNIVTLDPDVKLTKAIKTMNTKGISQIPIVKDNAIQGLITETSILEKLNEKDFQNLLIKNVMIETPPIVNTNTKISLISSILKHYPLVIVTNKGKIKGIITKSDLLKQYI
ncbi:MAG: CBS domain-containing protein [archaeon]